MFSDYFIAVVILGGNYLYGFMLSLDVMRRIGARSQIGEEISKECRSHTLLFIHYMSGRVPVLKSVTHGTHGWGHIAV